MFRNILVPVDFTLKNEPALDTALELARGKDARVTLLHVIETIEHVEFDLEVSADLKVPPELAKRAVPAQSSSVDGAGLFARAQLPRRKDKVWHIECAPLTRMETWKVVELKNGEKVAMVGFTFAEEKGDAVLRVEYLLVGDKTYGLRSSPA